MHRPPVGPGVPGVMQADAAVATIAPAETGVAAFVGRTPEGARDVPVEVHSLADAERLLGAPQPQYPLLDALADFFLNGGTHAYVVPAGASGATELNAADIVGDRTARTGIYALDAVDAFDLLVIPPDAAGRDVPAGVLPPAASYCVERRAFLIYDAPAAWEAAARAGNFDAIDPQSLGIPPDVADHAAVYFPRLQRGTGRDAGSAAPSGAIAGCIARNDRTRGTWMAPAGTEATLVGFAGLTVALDDRAVQRLNSVGVNTLRALPQGAPVIWGARTLRGADADTYRYVMVRRFTLFVETSISRGLQWTQFEPNDEPLWARVRASVTDFLMTTGVARFWPRPELGFFVRCDRTTMTQNDLDNGRLIVEVGVAPVKPAEYIVIRIGGWARKPPP